FQEAAPMRQCASDFPVKSDAHALIEVLSGLEEAYEDPAAFRAFCHRFQDEHPEVGDGRLVQWYLEPTEPHFGFWILDFGLPTSEHEIQNPKSKIQNAGWVWHDPLVDCSLTLRN